MPELTRAVDDTGYTQPTPVQVEAIPVILQGCDVLAGAQTGTGKTAGFTLPLLQRLIENPPEPGTCPVRALIVTPTRELAAQIEESVQEYGKYAPLRSTVVYGGVGMEPQVEALKAGVDILVATPGRLLDHANEQTVDLSQVEILVLDEADRMLDMGFIHDVKRILALLPAQRQNLLFSATFSDDIRALAGELLHDPVTVEVARRNAESELVAQRVHPVGQERKRALLTHLIKSGDWKQVLVFTRTKHGANRLAKQLNAAGIEADAIHGNKSQPQRERALAAFKDGTVPILVATDIAARGIDVSGVSHVFNFELPNVPEQYVHRIGRTGRAGRTGHAFTLVGQHDEKCLAAIERLIGNKIERRVMEGLPEETPQQNRGRDRGGRGDRRGRGGRDREHKHSRHEQRERPKHEIPQEPAIAANQQPAPKPVAAAPVERRQEPRPPQTAARAPQAPAPSRPKTQGHDASQLPAFLLRPVTLPDKPVKKPAVPRKRAEPTDADADA